MKTREPDTSEQLGRLGLVAFLGCLWVEVTILIPSSYEEGWKDEEGQRTEREKERNRKEGREEGREEGRKGGREESNYCKQ